MDLAIYARAFVAEAFSGVDHLYGNSIFRILESLVAGFEFEGWVRAFPTENGGIGHGTLSTRGRERFAGKLKNLCRVSQVGRVVPRHPGA